MSGEPALTTWLELKQVAVLPILAPVADPAVLLPATILVLAGLGAVTMTGVQALRSRGQARPRIGEIPHFGGRAGA